MQIDKLQSSLDPKRVAPRAGVKQRPIPRNEAFSNVLNAELAQRTTPVKFSVHAVERLASRNITLSEHDISRISRAVEKIEQKGGKESLMVMGDLAFVVSIRNRTVITVLDGRPGADQKVFTNIDSALIM